MPEGRHPGSSLPTGNVSSHRACRCLEVHLKRNPPTPQWEHDPQDHLFRTWAQQGTHMRLLLLQPIRMERFFNVSCSLLRRVRLFSTSWTVAHQTPLSTGFSGQEYWSGLSFPSPGDLPDPQIEPGSPALQADSLWFEPPAKPLESRTDSGQSQRLTSKLGAGVLVQKQGKRTGRGGCFFHIVQWALKIRHCSEQGATSKAWKPSWPRGPTRNQLTHSCGQTLGCTQRQMPGAPHPQVAPPTRHTWVRVSTELTQNHPGLWEEIQSWLWVLLANTILEIFRLAGQKNVKEVQVSGSPCIRITSQQGTRNYSFP